MLSPLNCPQGDCTWRKLPSSAGRSAGTSSISGWSQLPAAGDRARPKPGVSGISAGDLRQDLRRALRQSKTLLEAAEILRNEPMPHGKDRPNPPDGSWMNGRSVLREEDSCESSDVIDRHQYRLDQVETHIGADTRLHVDLCAGRAKGNDGRTLAGRMH